MIPRIQDVIDACVNTPKHALSAGVGYGAHAVQEELAKLYPESVFVAPNFLHADITRRTGCKCVSPAYLCHHPEFEAKDVIVAENKLNRRTAQRLSQFIKQAERVSMRIVAGDKMRVVPL